MKKLFSVILMLPLFSIGQTVCNCGTPEYVDEVTTRTGDCTQTSNDENDYFRRYQYQKDLYPVRNSIIIPIDIYVWQKDNRTEN